MTYHAGMPCDPLTVEEETPTHRRDAGTIAALAIIAALVILLVAVTAATFGGNR